MQVPGISITQRRIVRQPLWIVLIVAASYFGLMEPGLTAGPPRTLPLGTIPSDTRLGPLKGEQGDFSFVPARSPEEWEQRKEYVRQILRVTLGLWPMPTKSPLNQVVHGTIDRSDYTVEKVYFESIPGFYVTGNL
jgi:hypothetical protein